LLVIAFGVADFFIFPKLIDKNIVFKNTIDPNDPLSIANKHNKEFNDLKGKLHGKRGPNCCTRLENKQIGLYSSSIFPYHIDSLPAWKKKKGHEKELVITFDDGPHPDYTPAILDILKKEKVPASFFVVGVQIEENINLLKRILEEGHEIGNHTFTHPDLTKVTAKRAELEMRANKRLIESITLHSTTLYRPPFSNDGLPETNQEIWPISFGAREHYYKISNAIDTRDWEADAQADSIFARMKQNEFKGNILLLHDGGGKREETVKALPKIIKYFKAKGYTFVSLHHLMGVKKSELNPPLHHGLDMYFAYANQIIAHFIFGLQYVLFPFFFVGIILAIGRMAFIGTFAFIQFKRSKTDHLRFFKEKPLVSIIVPAYNEEVNVVSALQNLLKTDYPNFEIVFVDDGSKDGTYQMVLDNFKDHPRMRIFSKVNGGKASALNFGIDQSKGDFLVCIDADTQLRLDAVSQLMKYFLTDKVGAVAGNVKVGNDFKILTKWQSIEYITSQNFDRRAFDYFNCITVIPGAIGVFRKSAMLEAGKFDVDTLAEDCDLTIRILRNGHEVRYASDSVAMTEAPESLKQFIKQRFRWTFGIMQTFWKHKDACFNPKYKGLGLLALPNFLIFQLLIPILTPLADILMIASIVSGNGALIMLWYCIFLGVELMGALMAFSFEKEKKGKLWLMLLQRIIYKYLMWYVLMKSITKAIKGELIGWGILKRTGSVRMDNSSPAAAA
jgi:cellulose synthase/poly-beta-1,6-N-acetylglucosamine synthase-like glycosyltransferase/peptidoglycan/xylan/chitin deacetylase (PgdA/CDA1 family)